MITWRKHLCVYAKIRSFLATGLTQEAIFHVWCVCSRHPGCNGPAFVSRSYHWELKCAELLTTGERERDPWVLRCSWLVASGCRLRVFSDEIPQFGAFSLCFSVVYLVTHLSHTIHGNLCWDNSPRFLNLCRPSEVRMFNTIYSFEVHCTLLRQFCQENTQNVLKVGSSGFKCSTAVFVFCDKGLLYSVVILETSI